MEDAIKKVSLKFECPVNWDNMETVDGGRYCSHCQKTVYDFTDTRPYEFLQIISENNNNICGRFRLEQLTPEYHVLPAWKKWASAAMILAGLNLWGNKLFAQKPNDTTLKTPIPEKQSSAVFGAIEVVPEFPGGLAALTKFINDHLKKVEGAQGKRLIASFVVEADGSLTDVTIARGINEQADKEAIRVIKLFPKWKPGMQNDKPVKTAYSIPIKFN